MYRVGFYITIIISRLIYLAIKLLNKSSGTSFIGMCALKICPNFLKFAKSHVKTSFAVTGTNGKTTTSGFLAHILECQKDVSIVHNVKGANMITGIANVFALNIRPFKVFDYAVLESDEAYLTKLYDFYKTEYLLVTNLFRDQLDRYGELETTASYIQNAIDKAHPTLLLNADDPLVMNLGKGKNAIYYGFEDVQYAVEQSQKDTAPCEMFSCRCSTPLKYKKRFFAQQGHYYCENCGFTRPEPNIKAYCTVYKNYSLIKVLYKDKEYEFKINLVGLFNAYNALAAISQALVAGIDYKVIKAATESYRSIFGRTETRTINGIKTLIQLIKNPTGASEVLKTVDLNSRIIIAINDNYADGRDVSWLWDSDFEFLKDCKYPIVTTGIRAYDMAVRLKYAGIPTDKIIVEEDIKDSIFKTVEKCKKTGDEITILPTYTALLYITKIKGDK